MSELPNRFSIDPRPNQRKDGMTVEIPINPGNVKTIITIVLGEDGKVHLAGPINDPRLMKTLLDRAMLMVKTHEERKLIQPAQTLPPGLKPINGHGR